MSEQDEDLVNLVRDTLGLKNKVYYYKRRVGSDGYKRQGMANLIVRDAYQHENIVVPL